MRKRQLIDIVGDNICFYRKKKKFTIKELASLIDSDRSYIGQIENGRANPSLKKLFYIAKALDTPLSSLFKDNGPLNLR